MRGGAHLACDAPCELIHFDYAGKMDSKKASVGFSALAQETRLDAMRVLANAGQEGIAAGDLAVRLGLPPSTLSFHLAALEQAGLIASTRRGGNSSTPFASADCVRCSAF